MNSLTKVLATAAILTTGWSAVAQVEEDNWVEDAKTFIMENQAPDEYTPQELIYHDSEDQGLLEYVQRPGGWGGPNRRVWTCLARGWSGRIFSGRADRMSTARGIAFSRCTRATRGCTSRGCR